MYSVQSLFKDPKARLLTLIWLLQVQLEDDAAPPPGVPVPPPVDLDIPALTINRQGLQWYISWNFNIPPRYLFWIQPIEKMYLNRKGN